MHQDEGTDATIPQQPLATSPNLFKYWPFDQEKSDKNQDYLKIEIKTQTVEVNKKAL